MSLLNWLFGNKNPASARPAASDSVLSSQFNTQTRPALGARPQPGAAQPAVAASAQRLEQRRTERNAKRELLFQAVRESMVRIGVLSSSFKFKVLSLDQRGRSFLVMIELSAEFSGEAEKLAEIENVISQTARHRFDIQVQAVYWRYFNVATATASAPAPLLGAMHAPISRPAPLYGMNGAVAQTPSSQAAFMATVPVPRPAADSFQTKAISTGSFPIIGATAAQKAAGAQVKPAADDLSDDEVAAFRRALALGAAQGTAAAPTLPPAPFLAAGANAAASTLEKARSKLLLTGYEDTEMHDDEPAPALSSTQYGELR